jgi:hypothetical protein
MRIFKTRLTLLSMTLLAALVLPSARASEFDQKTILTFSQSVEIPGRVLPAGTYVFKVLDSVADRNVVQIFDEHEKHLYVTLLAVSEYRLQPTDNAQIQLKERTLGGLKAIQTWFYPGLLDGERFIYPKASGKEVGKQMKEPVPYMPSEVAPNLAEPTQPTEPANPPNNIAAQRATPEANGAKEESARN